MADLSPEEFKKVMQKREAAALAILKEQTGKVMHNEILFQKLLDMMALHVATTVSNTLLAQAQLLGATAVTSKEEWEKKNLEIVKDINGYYPSGIYQFAVNGQYIDKTNGEVHTKFKVFKGYDAAQTTNPEYARAVFNTKPAQNIFFGSDPKTVRNLALCRASPIKCILYDPKKLIDPSEDIQKSEGVRYIPETKTVIIRTVPKETWFQQVSYEIALGVLHKSLGTAYNRADCAAEGLIISYLLARRAGVDVSCYHFDLYEIIKKYPGERVFRKMLENCDSKAHDLAHRLNKKLEEQRKQRMAENFHDLGGMQV